MQHVSELMEVGPIGGMKTTKGHLSPLDKAYWARQCPHCGELLEPYQDEDGYWIPGITEHSCEELEAVRQERRERRAAQKQEKEHNRWLEACRVSGLSERRLAMNFENFDASRQPSAYEAAEHFFTMPETLVFCGPVGAGKTHLACAILHRWLKTGFDNQINRPSWSRGLIGGRGRFITLPELVRRIKATFNSGATETEDQIIRYCIGFPLLVLDDVGKEKKSEWTEQVLFSIIDGRYVANVPLIVTSNESKGEFAQHVGQAVYSRLSEMGKIINMKDSGDFRLRNV